MNFKQYLKGCNQVYHTTLDPYSSGVCRIHLVPPKNPKPSIPWVAILNGYSVLPLQSAWGVLLKVFIEELNKINKQGISEVELSNILTSTCQKMHELFPHVNEKVFIEDLDDMIKTFRKVIDGEEIDAKIGYMTLSKYGKNMSSPHRMDLMVSPMEKEGRWNCNQKCLHCYAAGEKLSSSKELSFEDWCKIIDKCQEANIPSLTFTGGEATLRKDLPELVKHASWFVTRLNTNGILLTKELCEKLFSASLDSVQVTLYSYKKEVHNLLVGGDHFDQTIQGIKNAIEAKLDVSVNTPLCSINSDYLETVKFLESLGVKYFSCSGLIPTGNAKKEESSLTKLSKEEITQIVKEASSYARSKGEEVSFTSPGWIDASILKELKMVVPSCGACLSNMAISPSGDVIPCQSWLGGLTFGNLLNDEWKDIWDDPKCVKIRKQAMKNEEVCLLKEKN